MPPSSDLPVCVIGCGFAGISICRQLAAHQIPFVAYDQAAEIGGLWRGVKQMYAGLTTNLPLQFMAFGFGASPPPLSPMFCGTEGVLKYLNNFVLQYNLKPHMRFNTKVVSVSWTGSVWEVETQRNDTLPPEMTQFRAVIVCNGHFYEPMIGKVEGIEKFAGKILHSSDFISSSNFLTNQRVLVIGSNSSGSDISSLLKQYGCDVHMYMRTGSATPDSVKFRLSKKARELGCAIHRSPPEFLGGKTVAFENSPSNLATTQGPVMPFFQRMFLWLLYDAANKHNATTSSPLEAKTQPTEETKSNVKKAFEFDTVILATGYRYSFPFLDKAQLNLLKEDGTVGQLFEHLFYIPNPTLSFIGLPNAVLPPATLFDFQSVLVARVLSGKCTLPATMTESKFSRWLGFQTPAYCNALARLSGLWTGYWWDFFIFKFWRLLLSALLTLRRRQY